jgi:ribosomal-protein-alanine N-acetyltransferase
MTTPSVRPLGPFDLQLLAVMHAACFTAAWDQPWSATSFADVLAMPGAAGWLIADGDEPAGFIMVRHVLDEMEVILIAIDPLLRQRGLAGILLDTAIAAAQAAGIKSVFLEQAAPNFPARALYASRGFRAVGERRGYYRGATGEVADAIILRLDLPATGVSNATPTHEI